MEERVIKEAESFARAQGAAPSAETGAMKAAATDIESVVVDCRILEGPGNGMPVTKAGISSFANPDGEKGALTGTPLMRHVQMNTSAPITPGKPVVISGVDELNSNHRFQLEVTATELK